MATQCKAEQTKVQATKRQQRKIGFNQTESSNSISFVLPIFCLTLTILCFVNSFVYFIKLFIECNFRYNFVSSCCCFLFGRCFHFVCHILTCIIIVYFRVLCWKCARTARKCIHTLQQTGVLGWFEIVLKRKNKNNFFFFI